MKIANIYYQHRFDFAAVLICEHCNETQDLDTGYNDEYYHNNVMPAITCQSCGKNRSGEVPETPNDNGQVSV